MSTLYTGSICVSDIPKEKLTQAKNGKLYLNLDLWVNDEKDQYGNIGSLSVRQTKIAREAKEKKVYIGNFKPLEKTAPEPPTAQSYDDLPF
jgi:hypothetical protein